jgi:hypothetical protein
LRLAGRMIVENKPLIIQPQDKLDSANSSLFLSFGVSTLMHKE